MSAGAIEMTIQGASRAPLALLAAVTMASGVTAQQTQRFLYAALPGVGGGNNLNYGGAGILVFDIDHAHKFVKRIPLQGAAPLTVADTSGPRPHATPPQPLTKTTAHQQPPPPYTS